MAFLLPLWVIEAIFNTYTYKCNKNTSCFYFMYNVSEILRISVVEFLPSSQMPRLMDYFEADATHIGQNHFITLFVKKSTDESKLYIHCFTFLFLRNVCSLNKYLS